MILEVRRVTILGRGNDWKVAPGGLRGPGNVMFLVVTQVCSVL